MPKPKPKSPKGVPKKTSRTPAPSWLSGRTSSMPGAAAGGVSDLQSVEVGNAGFHHFQVHFDEVILYAPSFRRGKDFLPIQGILSHRHHFLGFRRPTLSMHGKEAAGIFCEILRGVVAAADCGNLELELDQLRIEEVQQQVIGPP